MNNITKFTLILTVVSSAIGTVIKINGYNKSIGDIVLLISVISFYFLIYLLISKKSSIKTD